MRVFNVLQYSNVVELDVQVLVHTLQSSADGDVILELHRHLCVSRVSSNTSRELRISYDGPELTKVLKKLEYPC